MVLWDPAIAFPNIPIDCISGYQYTINGSNLTTTFNTSFTLDKSFPRCEDNNVLSIRPIVMVGNSILNNVVLTGSTCERRSK